MNCFEDLRQYLQLDKSQRYDFLAERLGSQVEEISIETQGRTDKHLLLNLQGEQEDNLWFSAHYDVFGEALGATDNSAAVLSLLHAVKDYRRNTKRPQSVTAVFFDAEEDGYKASGVKKDWQQGSDAFVKQLRSSQLFDGFSSLINFEVLSKGPFETYLTSTKDRIVNDEKLTKYVNSTLDQLGIVYNTVEESPRSDHVNFLLQGLPATVLARRDKKSWAHLHTVKDDISTVDGSCLEENIKVMVELMRNMRREL